MFADIPAPCGVTVNRLASSFVVVFYGCLCMVDPQSLTRTDIWITKEYGYAEPWTNFSIANDIWNVVKPLYFIGDEEHDS